MRCLTQTPQANLVSQMPPECSTGFALELGVPSCQPRADCSQSPSRPRNRPAGQSYRHHQQDTQAVTTESVQLESQHNHAEQSPNSARRQARTTWSSDPVTCRTPTDSRQVYTVQIYTIHPLWKNMTVYKRALIGGAIGPPLATQTASTQSTRILRPTARGRCHRDPVSIFRDI